MPSQTKIYFALLPAVTKRELPGKNKIRTDIKGSFPRMFSNGFQLWNFIGQRLAKLTEEDAKMVRYSPQRYILSAARSSAISCCIFYTNVTFL